MVGREIGVGISEQGLGSDGEVRIVVARAQRFAGVGRRGHGVDIGIVGVAGVRVVVEGRNFFDLGQQALVDLLDVGTGEGARLGERQDGKSDGGIKDESSKGKFHERSSDVFHRNIVLRLRPRSLRWPLRRGLKSCPFKTRSTSDTHSSTHRKAAVPCHAVDTLTMRSTASCRVAIEEAKEKRMKSLPAGPKAAPGMAATPASSSRMRHSSSALMPVAVMSTQA